MSLTNKQKRFVDEYLIDLNATQAAIRAGYSAKTAGSVGHENLRKPEIEVALAAARLRLSERAEITQEMVLRRYWEMATADPNDLIQYRRDCCRHCWGVDFAYQWTEEEFTRATNEAERDGNDPPSAAGGFGFDPTKVPNVDCPDCFGEGRGHVHVADTRRLKGAARLLYAGVKLTKDGLEVKMHDQKAALDKVGQHLGMFVEKAELSGPGGGPIQTEAAVTIYLPANSRDG